MHAHVIKFLAFPKILSGSCLSFQNFGRLTADVNHHEYAKVVYFHRTLLQTDLHVHTCATSEGDLKMRPWAMDLIAL